jgi:toxin HigB-1
MIRSFRDTETKKVFNEEFSKKFQAIARTALRKLIHLNRARSLEDLAAIPGDRLEALKGDREGQHSIRVNDRYRICFVWNETDTYDVEITG